MCCRPAIYHAFMDLNYRRLGERALSARLRGLRLLRADPGAGRRLPPQPLATPLPGAQRRRFRDPRAAGGERGKAPALRPLPGRAPRHHDGRVLGGVRVVPLHELRRPHWRRPSARGASCSRCRSWMPSPTRSRRSTASSTPMRACARSGTLNILWLIAEARRSGRPYVYLGYYVAESKAMRYKAGFRPCEIWSDGTWLSA